MDPKSEGLEDLRTLKVEEVAEVLGVSPETVRRYVRDGALPAMRWGGRIRCYARDVAAFQKAWRIRPKDVAALTAELLERRMRRRRAGGQRPSEAEARIEKFLGGRRIRPAEAAAIEAELRRRDKERRAGRKPSDVEIDLRFREIMRRMKERDAAKARRAQGQAAADSPEGGS